MPANLKFWKPLWASHIKKLHAIGGYQPKLATRHGSCQPKLYLNTTKKPLKVQKKKMQYRTFLTNFRNCTWQPVFEVPVNLKFSAALGTS